MLVLLAAIAFLPSKRRVVRKRRVTRVRRKVVAPSATVAAQESGSSEERRLPCRPVPPDHVG